jgi:hypothetical protein
MSGFRGTLYDEIDMPLVGLHPKSMELIGLAVVGSFSGRTVYFKINENARYSDGVSVQGEKDFRILHSDFR